MFYTSASNGKGIVKVSSSYLISVLLPYSSATFWHVLRSITAMLLYWMARVKKFCVSVAIRVMSNKHLVIVYRMQAQSLLILTGHIAYLQE